MRIQYVYAVQKQQRERINVTRKHIKLMRERESVRTHISFALSQNQTRLLRYTLLSAGESART